MVEKIVAIVPAYNEERHIRIVIQSLQEAVKAGVILDFLIVANGCNDYTYKKALTWGAKAVDLPVANKGGAFIEGVKWAHKQGASTVVTIDADAKRFAPSTLRKLVEPVITKNTPMSIGGYYYTGKEQVLYPHCFSGFRAISMKSLNPLLAGNKDWLSVFTSTRYSLEVALNGKIFGMNKGVFNESSLDENRGGVKEEKERKILKSSIVPFIFEVKRKIRSRTVKDDVEFARNHFRERLTRLNCRLEEKKSVFKAARLMRRAR